MVSAAGDAAVYAYTEERKTQGGDVVDVADDDILAAHVDGDDALSRNGSLAIVGESDVLVIDAMVEDESLVGVPAMVGGSAIKDCYLGVVVCGGGKDIGWAHRDYLAKVIYARPADIFAATADTNTEVAILDSGATHHLWHSHEAFISYHRVYNQYVTLADNSKTPIAGKG